MVNLMAPTPILFSCFPGTQRTLQGSSFYLPPATTFRSLSSLFFCHTGVGVGRDSNSGQTNLVLPAFGFPCKRWMSLAENHSTNWIDWFQIQTRESEFTDSPVSSNPYLVSHWLTSQFCCPRWEVLLTSNHPHPSSLNCWPCLRLHWEHRT